MSAKVRTRFAPSPTGYLHVGGLRTALYSYLFAQRNKGTFLLRIEDTDQNRLVEGAQAGLENILKLFGLTWKEKIMVQSQRLNEYQKAALELIKKGKGYYCFCTPERLQELRERQAKNKQPTGYDSLCRKIPVLEAAQRTKTERWVVRLAMPRTGTCKIQDAIRGLVEFSYALEEDPVILKSDGFPTYHLAHVVDDHAMKITHVIRGEEWLPSVPKHLVMWEAFGWEVPVYAHLALIVNPDKTKLSKRQGDVSVESYLAQGYLREALLNFILLLGWNPGDEREFFTLDEMIKEFSLEKIHKSPAVFNREKLDWINGHYIRSLSSKDIGVLAEPFFEKSSINLKNFDKKFVQAAIALEQPRIKKLSDLPESLAYFFTEPVYGPELLAWKKQTPEQVKEIISGLYDFVKNIKASDFSHKILEEKILSYIKEKNLSNGEVLWPMRVALSGRKASPGPFEIAGVLGQAETLKRLKKVLD